MEYTVIVVGLLLAFFFHQELKRIETRIVGEDDDTHDRAIDAEVEEETKSYHSRQEKLEDERKQLPGMSLWDIARGGWQEELMAKAEALRSLAMWAYGQTPDTHTFTQYADQMPMTYNYAHALADFALLRNDISMKGTEWAIKKIELLGMMRKRQVRLHAIAEAERELKDIEKEMEALERQRGQRQKAVCDAVFETMRTPSATTTSTA